jgi:hypothetical protein
MPAVVSRFLEPETTQAAWPLPPVLRFSDYSLRFSDYDK